MSPAPGWYFGGKNPDEQFGGFNLGGVQSSPPIQSTVATPNPASAGVAGQPAQPSSNGGMSALGVPFDQTGGPSSDSPAATPSGPGFSVGEAASTAGRGGSLSLGQTGLPGFTGLGSLSPNAVTTMNGLMGVTGLPTMAMGPAAVPFGLVNTVTNLAAHNMGDPAIVGIDEPSIATGNPNASDPSTTAVGNVNTAIGSIIAAIQNSNPATSSLGGTTFGSNGSTIDPEGNISNSLGTLTGHSTFGSSPQVSGFEGVNGPAGPAGPGTAGPGEAGQAPGEGPGAAPGGVGPGTGGTGGTAGSGGTGAGASAGYKFGGRVGQEKERAQARQRGQRPDPRRLAERRREGARVDVGDPRAKTDNVKHVDLQTGEMVVNKNATRAHLPDLERWNREGRRSMGGFAVGAPREARR